MPYYRVVAGRHSVLSGPKASPVLTVFRKGEVFKTTQILESLNSQGSIHLVNLGDDYQGEVFEGHDKHRSPQNFATEEGNVEGKIPEYEENESVNYEGMTVKELRTVAEEEEIDLSSVNKKSEIIKTIRKQLQTA